MAQEAIFTLYQNLYTHFDPNQELLLGFIYMALIYLTRPWTLTNTENIQTLRVNNILQMGKNEPTQYIYVKSVYSTQQFEKTS